MPRYPIGQSFEIDRTVKDRTGALTDASAFLLTLHRANVDGTVTTTTYNNPVHDGVGLYHWAIPVTDLTAAGQYQWSDDFTIAGGFHAIGAGKFDIYDPFEVTVLSLEDAKDFIDIPQATTKYDDEIARKVATIEGSLERMTGGPIVNRTISNERVRVGPGYRTLTVRYRPLVSVTSIVDVASGVTMSLADLDPDYVAGILRRKLDLAFFSRGPYYLVTYIAGQGVVTPAAFSEAACIILQHLWESQRGQSSAPQYGGEETVTLPGLGFAIPNRAAELLAPYVLEVYV